MNSSGPTRPRMALSAAFILPMLVVAAARHAAARELSGSSAAGARNRQSGTCPSGSTFRRTNGAPQCTCKDSSAHWRNGACKKGRLSNSAVLDAHNAPRAAVGAPSLVWSSRVARSALAWAKKLRDDNRCTLQHPSSGNYPYGQNLYVGTDSRQTRAVELWVNEAKDYTRDLVPNGCRGGSFGRCGHYTQVVWKNTLRVGCGSVSCRGLTLVCCEYDPPGNYIGQRPF